MNSRPITAAAVASLLVLLAAACGDDDDGSVDVSADALDGRTFVSDQVDGQTLVAGTEITLTFADEAVVALAGCNTMRGGFAVADGVLEVDAMAQTLMACPDDLQAQDAWLAEFLGSAPVVTLADEVLTLTGGEVTITATELT